MYIFCSLVFKTVQVILKYFNNYSNTMKCINEDEIWHFMIGVCDKVQSIQSDIQHKQFL